MFTRDLTIWTKTSEEKKLLKKAKRKSKKEKITGWHFSHKTPLTYKYKLIIYFKDKTYSTYAYPHEVNNIINYYDSDNHIRKYYFLGKTYFR